MLSLDALRAAQARLDGQVRHTPLLFSDSFSHRVGAPVYLKAENLQRTGSFKLRGAINKLAQLTPQEAAGGVIAASAGNHAQGVALAAAMRGISATVVMPVAASLAKYEATLGYGATVIRHGTSYDEASVHAQQLARKEGRTFIHAFDDEAVIAGQGTIGLELLSDLPDVELVVVPLGGGGLLAGIALAVKALRPAARVVGVQAATAPAAYRSYHGTRRVTVAPRASVADGIAVGRPGKLTLGVLRKCVDDVVLADEEAISHTVVLLLERSKLLVEGAGAVGLAALLAGEIRLPAGPVAVILSGGNLDVALLGRLVEHGLAGAGRYLLYRATLPDKPGQLAALLAHIGRLNANIIEVAHYRAGLHIPVGSVNIQLLIEVQNPEHGLAVRDTLTQLGYHELLLP